MATRGRKPRNPNRPRSETLSARISRAAVAKLADLATARGESKATVLESLIIDATLPQDARKDSIGV